MHYLESEFFALVEAQFINSDLPMKLYNFYLQKNKTKMKKTVKVTTYVELEYDPNSEEFVEALEGYNECINKGTDEDDLIEFIAGEVSRYGTKDMIEGVGSVKTRYSLQEPEAFCGVTILDIFYFGTELE